MPTIAEFISTQFTKAGIEPSAETKDILANENLIKLSLPDLQVKEVNDKLLTLEVAKESPVLKQHFRHTSLDPINKEIDDKYISEYEIPEDLATTIRSEKNTYEKIPLMIKLVKELQAKKATVAVGDKGALLKQIDELNAAILQLKNQAKQEKDTLISQHENEQLNWNIRGEFAGFDYSDQYDKSDAIELSVINLHKQLAVDGGRVVRDKATGRPKLVLATDTEQAFTKDNQKISFQDYASKLVADKKLIKTSESEADKVAKAAAEAARNQNQNNQNQNNQNRNQNNNGVPAAARQDILQALADTGIKLNGQ